MPERKQKIVDVLDVNIREYAQTVISERALPSITDGLKPTMRRVLYTAHTKTKGLVKVQELAGLAVKLVPTGPQGAEGAISLAAREWPGSNNYALFTPTGAVGTRVFDGVEAIAAPRYLFVELAEFSKRFLFRDAEVWDIVDNYDESAKEVKNFLPALPICLINGADGIAFSVATSILPHNPVDLAKVVTDLLDGKRPTEPTPWLKDFGGTIERTPDGKFILTGKVEQKTATTYEVTHVPPGISTERILERLDSLKDSGAILGYEDDSRDTHLFMVKTKRNAYTPAELVDLLKLRTSWSQSLNLLDESKTLKNYGSVVELLEDFVAYRLRKFEEQKQYWVDWNNDKAVWCLNMAEAIRVMRGKKFKTRAEVITLLQAKIQIDCVTDAADLRAYQITDEHAEKLTKEAEAYKVEANKWSKKTAKELFKNALKDMTNGL